MSKIVLSNQTTAPDAPAAGKIEIYSKTDNKLYKKDSSGTETEIGGGGGSGDMLKSTYDTNNDGKVNSADAADAVPWSGVSDKPASFTPSAHKTSHQNGGADAIKLDDLAAPDDNTDLNASASAHGLLPKLNNNTSNFLRGDGAWSAIPDSSESVKGIIEQATAAETTSGAANLAVTPAGLARSTFGKRVIMAILLDINTSLTVGPYVGNVYIPIPAELNGMNLVGAHAVVTTPSSSGSPTFQIYNATDAAYMLSTAITIDANEYNSYTATTPPVIDTSHDDVATGDLLKISCTNAGTGTKGLIIILSFQLP